MTGMTYTTHEHISLKGHPEFNEKWLQDRIAEDPAILGLGDVFVLDRERTQERAGRLDILLSSPEQDRRYEVELILVVPVKQTAPYRNSSANRTDTLLLRRSRSSSFLTGISDLMVGAFLI